MQYLTQKTRYSGSLKLWLVHCRGGARSARFVGVWHENTYFCKVGTECFR